MSVSNNARGRVCSLGFFGSKRVWSLFTHRLMWNAALGFYSPTGFVKVASCILVHLSPINYSFTVILHTSTAWPNRITYRGSEIGFDNKNVPILALNRSVCLSHKHSYVNGPCYYTHTGCPDTLRPPPLHSITGQWQTPNLYMFFIPHQFQIYMQDIRSPT